MKMFGAESLQPIKKEELNPDMMGGSIQGKPDYLLNVRLPGGVVYSTQDKAQIGKEIDYLSKHVNGKGSYRLVTPSGTFEGSIGLVQLGLEIDAKRKELSDRLEKGETQHEEGKLSNFTPYLGLM